jgi:hypothetical protein
MTHILFALLLGATVVHAADQTILGTEFVVKDAGFGKVTGKAKEKASSNTLVGDPTVDGATLTVRAHGATSTEQTFALPQGTRSPICLPCSPNAKGKPFWTGSATSGFKYKDSKGENSAVAQAAIKKNKKGVFTIAFKANAKIGTKPGGPGPEQLDVVPPNPGDSACLLLQLTGGDSYSIRFGPGDGKVTNKDHTLLSVAPRRLFKVSKPADEGTCVIAATTSAIATTRTTVTTTSIATSTGR